MDLSIYKRIIAYGIGQNFHSSLKYIDKIPFTHVMDQKWKKTSGAIYCGFTILGAEEQLDENDLIVVFPNADAIYNQARAMYDCQICKITDILSTILQVTGSQLKEQLPINEYKDERGNTVIFDDTIDDNLLFLFYGENNYIEVEKNVSAGLLHIVCGNNSKCIIGENVTAESAWIYVSEGSICIGDNCMLAHNIRIRNHDNHHIFDKNSGIRINYSRDIDIGKQVWIGEGVSLLPGARIGCGSIVGEGAVTSSQFPNHVIIAGSPAKVVRENICWSRDNTFYFNRDSLDECLDQNAKKYL